MAFFAFIAAAEPDDDWTDPEVWRKANPSFGITVNADQFAEDCKEAQESPAKENSFRRYRLNQWDAGAAGAARAHQKALVRNLGKSL